MGKIQDTFNLKRGVLTETQRKTKMDDETLKFIRQKRPHMQSKGRRHVYDADPASIEKLAIRRRLRRLTQLTTKRLGRSTFHRNKRLAIYRLTKVREVPL
ncbi:hypothetical protein DPMN_003124 [Dreissena polymorpha]|uniref:Uncharacterized protein n=1 Tax=Dreissena polymorpha TaxID=45954 RepID=A0A9D4MPC8_DREPO|nr:hypothetical protein DPMN_003124 [Dreissena polymorpha]